VSFAVAPTTTPGKAATAPADGAGHGSVRIAALDGVRGLAILLVVVNHAGVSRPFAGGVGGVTMFFVLSGFLITGLLLKEFDRTGRIAFGMFWLRRGVRLLPALWVFLAVTAIAVSALGIVSGGRSPWHQAFPVFFYYANYAELYGPLDYFEHTWSLSVEEQFYVIWPVLTLLLLRRIPRRAMTAAMAVVLVGGLLARWSTANTIDARILADRLLLARSLQTNFWALGLGALLACLVSRARWVPRVPSWVGLIVAAAGLDLLPWLFGAGRAPWYGASTAPYVFGLTGALLIVVALRARSGWLTWPWLTYCGRRSYAWYLYHFPLVWGVGALWPATAGIGTRLGAVAVALLAAEISWHLVERPAQRLLRRWLKRRDRQRGGAPAAPSGPGSLADPSPRA